MHAVVERYDGFVLDLWGVVHDGVTVFPGVIDALKRLRDASKNWFPIQRPEASRNRRSATRMGLALPRRCTTASCPPAKRPGGTCTTGPMNGTGARIELLADRTARDNQALKGLTFEEADR